MYVAKQRDLHNKIDDDEQHGWDGVWVGLQYCDGIPLKSIHKICASGYGDCSDAMPTILKRRVPPRCNRYRGGQVEGASIRVLKTTFQMLVGYGHCAVLYHLFCSVHAKTDCLNGCGDWNDLTFVERERTPRELMELRYSTPPCWTIAFEYRSRIREFGVEIMEDSLRLGTES